MLCCCNAGHWKWAEWLFVVVVVIYKTFSQLGFLSVAGGIASPAMGLS